MARRSRTALERAEQLASLRTRPARGRMLAAAMELATTHGYESLRAGEIAAAAGVSRETFYTHFADKRACLAEATQQRLADIDSELRIAAEQGESWAAPIIASLEAALQLRYGSKATPRGRITEAMLDQVAEHGYAAVRLADVIKAAKVSYPSFYRHFEGKDECFAAACEALIARLSERLRARLEGEPASRGGPATRLFAAAELFADEPLAARILVLEAEQHQQGRGPNGDLAMMSLSTLLNGRAATESAEYGGPNAGAIAGDPGSTLLGGAFLELLRRAIIHARLEDFPRDVERVVSRLAGPLQAGNGIHVARRPSRDPRRAQRGGRRRPAPLAEPAR